MRKLVFLDIETKDFYLTKIGINFKRDDIIILGLGIITEETRKYYNFFVDGVSIDDFNYLQCLFTNNILIGHNISYDVLGLSSVGFDFNDSILLDTIFLQSLINENEESYSLKNLAKKYLKIDKTDYLLQKDAQEKFKLKNKQKNFYKYLDELDQNVVKDYCLQDIEITKKLFELQCNELPEIKEFCYECI